MCASNKKGIRTLQQLAVQLAEKAAEIRNRIKDKLRSKSLDMNLHNFFKTFSKNSKDIRELDLFVDSFIQTIIIEIFFLHMIVKEEISYEQILKYLPNSNPLLKQISKVLPKSGTLNFTEVNDLTSGIRGIIKLFNLFTRDLIYEEFRKEKSKVDLITLFFETFLKSYNPKQKVRKGIFHTPTPIVSFIIRSVDYLLEKEFKLVGGFANTAVNSNHGYRVQVLDPATGTGIFLEQLIRKIKHSFDETNKKLDKKNLRLAWNDYVSQDLLPRIHGVELLLAPYLTACLKMRLLLEETGYEFHAEQRLRIHQENAFNFSIQSDRSVSKALQDICVVIGNPPYSRSSANKGPIITSLLNSYKQAVRREKNLQPLSDDYIKFIRWSQELIERNGRGIIGMVTNHTFLSGIIHRGMRQELMKTFDSIYILDLHGSKIIHEAAPDDVKDENVFDIKQGICIFFLIKNPKATHRKLFYYDLYGSKTEKFNWLNNHMIPTIKWSDISDIPPGAPFLNSSSVLSDRYYEKCHKITDLFKFHNVGGKPGDDKLLISFNKSEVIKKLRRLIEKIQQGHNIGRKTETKQNILKLIDRLSFDESKIEPYNYRPFDRRWTYYDPRIWTRPVRKLKDYCHENTLLLCSRIIKDKHFAHIFISKLFTDVIFLSNTSSVNCYVFPALSRDETYQLKWNLSQKYMTFLKEKGIELTEFTSFKPLAYIYAILFSNLYRERFDGLLKRDFPRIPFIEDSKMVRKLIQLGEKLIQTHLQIDNSGDLSVIQTNIVQNDQIHRGFPKFADGFVYISPKKWFHRISKEVWNYRIGKYQICQKWLKDRQAKFITDGEIIHYKAILVTIIETIRLVDEIDLVLEGYKFGEGN